MASVFKTIFGGKTFESRIAASGGHTNGFDYLRIILSIAIVCIHSAITSYGVESPLAMFIWEPPWRPFIFAAVPMFFALSGFLVTGSLLRSKTVTEFVTLRILRIAPALFLMVIVIAFCFGPLLTVSPLHKYFTSSELWTYLLNAIGLLHLRLPGLFLDNPDAAMVNPQLWTIPVELRCYAILLALSFFGIARYPKLMLFLALFYLAVPIGNAGAVSNYIGTKLLIVAFLLGVVFYLFRDRIRLNFLMLAGSLLLSYLLLYYKGSQYLAMLPLTYMTVYLGLCNPKKIFPVSTGDYSYGLYLYSYPIHQAYVFLFPEYRVWWINTLVSLVAGLACAMISWHLLEHRILQHRAAIIEAVQKISKPLRTFATHMTDLAFERNWKQAIIFYAVCLALLYAIWHGAWLGFSMNAIEPFVPDPYSFRPASRMVLSCLLSSSLTVLIMIAKGMKGWPVVIFYTLGTLILASLWGGLGMIIPAFLTTRPASLLEHGFITGPLRRLPRSERP